ncbi:SDR family NAD(P)-dependent oxidoreductase [Brevundimonas diminuta]|uniref:SDR family NAD(P)-dependent oxidoreductase n=1 Tax=Brevundimonas diminuta TaxID=293 RepID=UPI00320A73FD
MSGSQLDGHVILVTGAGGGLGAAMAEEFLARGAQLLLTDHRVDPRDDRPGVSWRKADLGDRDQVRHLASWALDQGMTSLVNNAGLVSVARIEDFPDADWDQQIAVNLTAVHLLTKHFVAGRIRLGGGGSIVNIASMSYKGMTRQAAYVASKGGVVSLTKATAMEAARYGIRANAVAPGMTETHMTNPADGSQDNLRESMTRQIPMRRYGQPREVATTAAFLLSDDAGYVTGEVIHVSGGARL